MALHEHFGHTPPHPLVTAEIANTPGSPTDEVRVLVPSFDGGEHELDALGWTPRGTALPSQGDPCLVAIDENGECWIVAWMPG